MLPISATRAQQARRFLALHRAFGLNPDELPKNSKEAASAAYCDALSYSNCAEYTPGEVFGLSDRLMNYRDGICGGAPAIYDVEALATAEGIPNDVALLACRLCGAWIDGSSWRDDGAGDPIILTFEGWGGHDL